MNLRTLASSLLVLAPTVASAQEPVDSIRRLAPQQTSPALQLRALADAEGDGDVDVLSLVLDRDQIWFNDGAGGFTPGPENMLPFPNNLYPDSVRFGDVTGDGRADMIVIDLGSPLGIQVHPGQVGGTFGAYLFIATGAVVRDFDLGDADGDGDLDIVETHAEPGNEYVTWWSWNGSAFVAGTPLIDTDPTTTVKAIGALDVDLDGDDDILVVESQGPNLAVLHTIGGTPTLSSSQPLGLPISSSYKIVIGDLDGDGIEDAVVARPYASRLDVQPALNPGTGGMVLAAAQILDDYDVNSYAAPYFLGDWDGDGDAELLSEARTTSGGVSRPGFFVHENDGNHVFSIRSHVMSDAQHTGAGPADFDGDGHLDFASVTGIKFGNGTFHDTLVQVDPVEHKLVDWEGDGDLDLFGAGSLGLIGLNDGTGTFTVATNVVRPPIDPSEFFGSPIMLGDYTGDGGLDFIAAKRRLIPPFTFIFLEMHLLVDDGTGLFSDAGPAGPSMVEIPGNGHSESQLFVLGAHDLDGDGSRDVLTDGGYWANDGTGYFDAFTPLFAGRPVAAFDVEGDGDLDVVTYVGPPSYGAPAQMNLLRHDGSLGFTTELLLSEPFLHYRAELVDLDEDGDTDLTFGTDFQRNELFLFENLAGSLLPGPVLTVDYSKGNAVFVEDFDGNGLGDLVTGESEYDTNGSEENLYVFPRTGAGLSYGTPVGYIGRTLQGGGDVDADGDLDAVGEAVVFNWEHDGPAAGGVRQYGDGIAGSGGAIPVLGASGPLRPGSPTARVKLRRGVGGTIGVLAVGLNQAELVDVPFAGFTTLVDPLLFTAAIFTVGSAGIPGAGAFDLPLGGIVGPAAGLTFYAQVALVDPGGVGGWSSSNGLELSFGY